AALLTARRTDLGEVRRADAVRELEYLVLRGVEERVNRLAHELPEEPFDDALERVVGGFFERVERHVEKRLRQHRERRARAKRYRSRKPDRRFRGNAEDLPHVLEASGEELAGVRLNDAHRAVGHELDEVLEKAVQEPARVVDLVLLA